MIRNAQHWPGAVGMFLASGTPYFVVPSFRDDKRIGQWHGFAASPEEATRQAAQIAARHPGITLGQPEALSWGVVAAVITGADLLR